MSAASVLTCLIIPAFTGWPINTSDNPTKQNMVVCHLKIIIHLIIKLKYVCVCMVPIEFLFIFIQILPTYMCVYNRFTENVTNKTAIFFFLPSVEFGCSVMSDSWWPHGLQNDRPPCPSPTPGIYSNSCPFSRWCHQTISFSIVPFSSCLQSFPESGSFQMSQIFASGGQSIGGSASTSVLPVNSQDWSPLGWTGWISLQSKGLSRVFSNTTVQKHQFFGAELSL